MIASLVFDLGAGRVKKTDKIDYSTGVIIEKPLGSKVHKGDILGVIYYNKKIENMDERFKESFKIDTKKKKVSKIIIKTIS